MDLFNLHERERERRNEAAFYALPMRKMMMMMMEGEGGLYNKHAVYKKNSEQRPLIN